MDELSTDGTPEYLRQLGIQTLQPPERLGVTYNWNMVMSPLLHAINCDAFVPADITNMLIYPDSIASLFGAGWRHALVPRAPSTASHIRAQGYQHWLNKTDHEAMVFSNNDVLIPDGVLDSLLVALTPEGSRLACFRLSRCLLTWHMD